MFWSPQGEGLRAGQMSMFIRMSGCNMKCAMEAGPKSPGGFDCDTEFESGRRLVADEIVEEANALIRAAGVTDTWRRENKAWVVLTGGEPALQIDTTLVDTLHAHNFLIAVETNGSIDLTGSGVDWIVCSPKVAEHAVRCKTADEIRYVRGHGQGIPKPACEATHKWISPAFDGLSLDRRALAWCVDLIKQYPDWRLSVQQHKWWGVR